MDESYESQEGGNQVSGEPPAAPQDDLGIGPPPDQSAYDDYDAYLGDKIAYETRKTMAISNRQDLGKQTAAVAAGVRQALDGEPPNPLREIVREHPEMEREFQEEKSFQELQNVVNLLGISQLDNNPAWQYPIFQRGISKNVRQWNERNPEGSILVAAEEEEFGATKPLRPSNMLIFKNLGREEADRILRLSQNYSGDENQKIWRALRSQGYKPEHAHPSFYPSQESFDEGRTRLRYQGLSQKEYEALREREGAKKW